MGQEGKYAAAHVRPLCQMGFSFRVGVGGKRGEQLRKLLKKRCFHFGIFGCFVYAAAAAGGKTNRPAASFPEAEFSGKTRVAPPLSPPTKRGRSKFCPFN